jgi:hypothetical protein
MIDRRFTNFVPKWARDPSQESLGEAPVTGQQPDLAPALPIRLLPHDRGNSITALTLSQIAATTQRILNYASYEVVHGISPEFADLRSAENEVLELAQLDVDPSFAEGSFIIPAKLTEKEVEINGQRFSGVDVLQRFVDAMDAIGSNQNSYSVAIGMLQAVEELGRIINREALIEYSAFGLPGMSTQSRMVVVDKSYIQKVANAKVRRRSTQVTPDVIEGKITAVDIVKFTFVLQVDKKRLVRGSYDSMVADQISTSLGKRVGIIGVIEYVNLKPNHVRAFSVEQLD